MDNTIKYNLVCRVIKRFRVLAKSGKGEKELDLPEGFGIIYLREANKLLIGSYEVQLDKDLEKTEYANHLSYSTGKPIGLDLDVSI